MASSILLDEAVGLDPGLVAVEAQIGVQAGHAHVEAGFDHKMVGLGPAETRLFPDPDCQQHDVDLMALERRRHHCARGTVHRGGRIPTCLGSKKAVPSAAGR